MKKIGILTFHYSANYGGVLQAVALQSAIATMGFSAELIDFIPSTYKGVCYIDYTRLIKTHLKPRRDKPRLADTLKRVAVVWRFGKILTNKFETYRNTHMPRSRCIDEKALVELLAEYDVVVVGSDQIWNPSQRSRPEYFLDYGDVLTVKRISYAADSTLAEVDPAQKKSLKAALDRFDCLSVRNAHSCEFVFEVTGKTADIVADPTLLIDFEVAESPGDYIFAYVIGKEIEGSHAAALKKIRQKVGNLPVYACCVPAMNMSVPRFADKVYYNLGPEEWLEKIRNAKFVYTDSFHGVLFSLKYHRPFLAYYSEVKRAGRFEDLGVRYGLKKHIVSCVEEIEQKKSLDTPIDFAGKDALLHAQRKESFDFLRNALK